MQSPSKCFLETRLLSSALHVLCDHMWREWEERKCQDPEECLEPSGRKSRLQREPEEGGRARWWRRVLDWRAEQAGPTDPAVMLSCLSSCRLLQSRLKRRPRLSAFHNTPSKIHFHTFMLMFQSHEVFFSWKRKRGKWFNILGLKTWVSYGGVSLSLTDGSNSPQLHFTNPAAASDFLSGVRRVFNVVSFSQIHLKSNFLDICWILKMHYCQAGQQSSVMNLFYFFSCVSLCSLTFSSAVSLYFLHVYFERHTGNCSLNQWRRFNSLWNKKANKQKTILR